MNTQRSLLFVAIVTALALASVEILLRQMYPTLPSMAPLSDGSYTLQKHHWDSPGPLGPAWKSTPCTLEKGRPFIGKPRLVDNTLGPRTAPPLNITFLGDSLTAGMGVKPDNNFATKLSARLAQDLNRQVTLRNKGVPGAGLCEILTFSAIERQSPPNQHLIVLTLFADDLEHRAIVMIGDEIVLMPNQVKSLPLRAIVSSSYFANLAWLAIAPRMHTMPDRMILPEDQAFFKGSLQDFVSGWESTGAEVVIALLAPAGIEKCPKVVENNSRCRWLKSDMDLMATMMTEADIAFVDMRGLWKGKALSLVKREKYAVESGKMDLGIHPDKKGHTAIADVLYPVCLEKLSEP